MRERKSYEDDFDEAFSKIFEIQRNLKTMVLKLRKSLTGSIAEGDTFLARFTAKQIAHITRFLINDPCDHK
jgi:hypothetical protein